MIDFGQWMIATLNQEYPLVSQKVYIFCLSKSINWHVQELGLSIAVSFSKVLLEFYLYLMSRFWMKTLPIQVIGFYIVTVVLKCVVTHPTNLSLLHSLGYFPSSFIVIQCIVGDFLLQK